MEAESHIPSKKKYALCSVGNSRDKLFQQRICLLQERRVNGRMAF